MSDDNNCCNVELTLSESPMVMLDALGSSYIGELPTMSTVQKGGAKVGAGLEVDSDEYLNIAPSGVVSSMIDDGAITSAKIADGAVTTGKIADGAVTPDKIPNGSVTINKLSNDLAGLISTDYKVVHTYNEALATTETYVRVVDFSNYYVDGANVLLKSHQITNADAKDEAEAIGVKRADGSYLLPEPSYSAPRQGASYIANAITGSSFMNRGIIYGRTNGVFNNDTAAGAAQSMVCSDFAWAVLNGIDYNTSKFKGAYNVRSIKNALNNGNTASQIAPVEKEAFITRELAAAFAYANNLFKVSSYEQILPGDVIFFATQSYIDQGLYLGIDHCALVLDVDLNQNNLLIMQSGGEAGTLLYNFQTNSSTIDANNAVGICEINTPNVAALYIGRPLSSACNVLPKFTIRKQVTFTPSSSSTTILLLNQQSDYPDGGIPANAYIEMKIKCSDMYKLSENLSNASYARFLMSRSSTGNYRFARKYYEKTSKVPCEVVLKGITNDLLTYNGLKLGLNFSTTRTTDQLTFDIEINVY